ncbi:MAG: hypothetical protein F6K58_00555 [Symploca sp. SIO2E9]|nr:hypothetical protein [Symploca sp. SIO2E9]
MDTESAANNIDKQNFMGLLDIKYFMNSRTEAFIKELKEYNSNCCLAKEIYYCKPVISGYKPLKFAQEKEQYDQTINWGQKNPEKISINIENYQPTV